jgi:hypothetical protein
LDIQPSDASLTTAMRRTAKFLLLLLVGLGLLTGIA